jgi:beta-lactamase regulating signal transducer with metallopeptidase domain
VTLLLDHLWQSTLVAALAGLLTLGVRRHAAAVRFCLWFAASLKFLLPFALLTAAGRWLSALGALPTALPLPGVQPSAQLILLPAQSLLAAPDAPLPADASWFALLHWGMAAIWLGGALLLTAVRMARWRQLRRVLRGARAAAIGPVKVRIAASPMEPGLVGLFQPVVLLPSGLSERMTRAEMNAILSHELAHHRRRDNLAAAAHMLVETLFWFWPVVWLIGARMIAERERACDERVLEDGHDPHVYASGILKVCRFCARTPLACVSGASATVLSAAGLAARMVRITADDAPQALGRAKGAMLMALAGLLLAAPLLAAMIPAGVRREVNLQAAAVQQQIRRHIGHNIDHTFGPGIGPVVGRTNRLVAIPAALLTLHRAIQPAPAAADGPAVSPLPDGAQAAAFADRARTPPHPQSAAAPDAEAARLSVAIAHAHMALYPNGNGDSEAVTCRVPQYLPASRFKGPTICKINRIWALLRARSLEFSAYGRELVSTAHGIRVRLARKAG